MAESKNHCIKAQGTLVEVTEEVYLDYFRARRRWAAQEERAAYNGVVSYDAMDTEDTLGEETIPDLSMEMCRHKPHTFNVAPVRALERQADAAAVFLPMPKICRAS